MKKFRIIVLGLMCILFTSCDPYFWMGMLMGVATVPTYTTNNYSSVNTYQTSSGYQSTSGMYSNTNSSSSMLKSPSKSEGCLFTMVYLIGPGKNSTTGETVPGEEKASRMDFYIDRLVDMDGTVFYLDKDAKVEGVDVFKTEIQKTQGVETQMWLGINYDFNKPQLLVFLMGNQSFSHRVYFMTESQWNQFVNSGTTDGIPSFNDSENTSSSSESTYTPRTPKKCGLCNGKGRIATTQGVTSFGKEKWCSECNKMVIDSHHHEVCPSCKGKGEW